MKYSGVLKYCSSLENFFVILIFYVNYEKIHTWKNAVYKFSISVSWDGTLKSPHSVLCPSRSLHQILEQVLTLQGQNPLSSHSTVRYGLPTGLHIDTPHGNLWTKFTRKEGTRQDYSRSENTQHVLI